MTDSSDTPVARETIHATSVAIRGRGVLILGPSGSGKSDLALRLIDRGASLISDDYTVASSPDGRLLLDAPPNIAGRMEIRHLGIVDIPCVGGVPANLVIELKDSPPRMPDQDQTFCIAGILLPLVTLSGLEPSAPIKVEFALDGLRERGNRR